MKLAIVEKKNFLSWTAMHIDFVMCKKIKIKKASSGFVSGVEIGVNERKTLCNNLDEFPVAGPII